MPCGCAEVCTCFLTSSNTVDVGGSGTAGDPWIPVVVVDPEGGLQTGVDGVAILIDPASTLPFSFGPDGLLLECCPTAVMDSETIDFEISGGAVTGEVILDPEGGLHVTGDGVAIELDPASTADVSLGPDGLRVDVDAAAIVDNAWEAGDYKYRASNVSSDAAWKLCDGSSLLVASFPALFAKIGYAFGGAGANFNLPDFRGRGPIHPGTHLSVDTVGDADALAIGARTPIHGHAMPHSHAYTPSGTNAANGTGSGTDNGEANNYHTGHILRDTGAQSLCTDADLTIGDADFAPSLAACVSAGGDKFTKLVHSHPVPAQVFTGNADNTGGVSTPNTSDQSTGFLVGGYWFIRA